MDVQCRFPLKLAPEYQSLLASGNLKPSEAIELARLTPRGQATLFKAIRSMAVQASFLAAPL
jgi:hypothetical protein